MTGGVGAADEESDQKLLQPIQYFKLLVIGSSAVGKTSLVIRACSGLLPSSPHATIVAENFLYFLTIGERRVRLDLWDTAGQERFSSLIPLYYRGAKGAIVVFDVTLRATFEAAKKWIDQLFVLSNSVSTISLVGNKLDLLEEPGAHRAVSREEAEDYAKEMSILYAEASAVTGEGLEQILRDLSTNLLQKMPSSKPMTAPKSLYIRRWPPVRPVIRRLQTIPESPLGSKSTHNVGPSRCC